MADDDPFESEPARDLPEAVGAPLVVDLEGFEGPIDMLLALARDQKVDLTRISILQLADQYLAYIAAARRIELEVAADYLVMAAWLAYLKSRLLLPDEAEDEEPSGEELAAALQFQLRRLEAMRAAGAKLMERPRLGRDMFLRGAPEGIERVLNPVYGVDLLELLRAYGDIRRRTDSRTMEIEPTRLYSVDEAIRRLSAALGNFPDWATLTAFLPDDFGEDETLRRSALASTFGASLELAREGKLRIRQAGTFGPVYLRRTGDDS